MANPSDIVSIVKSYVGDSLLKNKADLAELIARQVDDQNQIVQIHTNCGMFALGVWWLVGVQHDILKKKYVNGMAISWVRKIATDLNALRKYPKDGKPVAGALLHYYTPNENDNHVEFLLSDPDEKMIADHGGGGRNNNEIGEGTSDISWSYKSTKHLQEWIDPIALLAGSPEFVWNPKPKSDDVIAADVGSSGT